MVAEFLVGNAALLVVGNDIAHDGRHFLIHEPGRERAGDFRAESGESGVAFVLLEFLIGGLFDVRSDEFAEFGEGFAFENFTGELIGPFWQGFLVDFVDGDGEVEGLVAEGFEGEVRRQGE